MYNSNFDKAANARKTVAVEFKDGKLRLMQFQRQGNSYVLRTFIEEELPEDAVKSNMLLKPIDVGKKLRKLIQEAQPNPPDTQFAICLIPQKDIFLVTQEIPKVSIEEAEKVVINKIADLIPMSVNDVYWDWRVIGYNENRLHVQIAASPQDLIDSYMSCLEEAKIIPLLFEPGAEAASRVGDSGENTSNLIWIELTDSSAIISIVKNESIIFSTDIPLELSPSGGINTNQLLNKIRELISYTQRQANQQITMSSRLRLYGRTDMVDKVLSAMHQQKKDDIYLSRIKLQQSDKSQLSKYITKLDEYVPLVGAAIRGLPNHTASVRSLNLIPNLAKENFVYKERLGMAIRYLFIFIFNAMLILVAVSVLALQSQQNLQKAQVEFANVQNATANTNVEQLKKQVEELNKTTSTIKNITEQLYEWDRVLLSVSENIPDDLVISQYSLKPAKDDKSKYEVFISGGYNNRDSILVFADALRKLPYFTDVRVPLSSLSEDQGGEYQIVALLVREELLQINQE